MAKKITYEEAYQLAKAAGAKFPGIVAAQFGLETGWGTKTANAKNNLFNLKWRDSVAKRMSEWGITPKKAKKGALDKATGSYDHYMEFESVKDAFLGYLAFLEVNPRYKKALQANTPEEYIQGLKDAGYAEDNEYVNKILNIAKHIPGESAINPDHIQGGRRRGEKVPGIEGVIKDAEKEKDKIQTPATPKNINKILDQIDFSKSTLTMPFFDSLEDHIAGKLVGASEAIDAKMGGVTNHIMKNVDTSKLDTTTIEVEKDTSPEVPEMEVPDMSDITSPQLKQAKGGYQPNGRRTNFTREEDIKAQGNTYEQLNIF